MRLEKVELSAALLSLLKEYKEVLHQNTVHILRINIISGRFLFTSYFQSD